MLLRMCKNTNKLCNYVRLVEKYACFLAKLIFSHFYPKLAKNQSKEELELVKNVVFCYSPAVSN